MVCLGRCWSIGPTGQSGRAGVVGLDGAPGEAAKRPGSGGKGEELGQLDGSLPQAEAASGPLHQILHILVDDLFLP